MESEAAPATSTILSQEPPTAQDLLEAANSDDSGRLTLLLDRFDADIDVKSRGHTALHLAARQGDTAAAETLLDHGADIEARTPYQRRPLHLAVKGGNAELVGSLLRRGAVPDAAARGLTPLHDAVHRGNIEVARLLLDHGADVNPTTDNFRDPLFLSVEIKKPDIIKLLLERGADPDSFFTEDPPTSLHLAADNGDVEAIQALLDGGALVDPRDFDGATPLFRAVGLGHFEAAKLLLQRGANSRTWRLDGISVFDLAEGHSKILELLQGETVLQGPRIRMADQDPEDQSGEPFTTLRPLPPPPENDRDKVVACQGFEAIVVDFFTSGEHEQMIPKTASIYELLYSHGPEAFRRKLGEKKSDFTWYHLPANNVWDLSLLPSFLYHNIKLIPQ